MTDQDSSNAPPAPRARRPSLRDVAQTAGVAISSASRVLSGHPDVSPTMRDRVLEAAEEIGYEQNRLWDSLRSGTSHTVGMIVRDISSRLWADIALGAELQLQGAEYSMLLANSRGEASVDASQVKLLNQRRVDGLLIAPNDTTDPETKRALARLQIPIVAIDRDLPPDLGAGGVLIDHAAGVRLAVDDILKVGHRSIAFISPPPHLRPAVEVSRALHEAAYDAGPDVVIRPGPFTPEHGYEATHRLLTGAAPPTAIISGSGMVFPGVLRAIRTLGMRIPDDVSLVAIDDIPLLSEFQPRLAIVTRQPHLVGETAATILLSMLSGEPPTVEVIPTVYTPGESVARPPA